MKQNPLISLAKEQVKILIGIVLFLLSLPIIAFIINFRNQAISSQISDWGTLGDFLGGTIGTTINLINLVFLIYITYKLSGIDASREKDNIKFQSLISLNELRNNSYKDIIHTLKLFTSETIMGDSSKFNKCVIYASEVEAFCEGMSHLFPFLKIDSNYRGMIDSMQVILENTRLRKGELSQEQKVKYRQDTNDYVEKKDEFIKRIQLDIISNNPLKLIQYE